MTFVLFPVLSFIYICIFLLLYFFKKRMIIFENKVVIVMMIVNAIGLLLELGCYAVLCWLRIQDTFLGMFIMKSYIAYIAVFNWLLTEVNYSLKNEIENLVKINRVRIGDRNINFRTSISPDLPYELIGDKTHIVEIINNLLTNAIKYTDEGEIDSSIECINTKFISNIIISVRDTGRGIKEENISKLFTKFERLDTEVNSDIEGTGLGLAITKSLIEMMDGSITVQSVYGEGSTFTVKFPQKISILESSVEEEIYIL